MGRIRTLYIVNHSHTDIGFTDYQEVCFRQHAEFIDQALDLIEATAHYPEEARYRWVCEVTGTLERYLRHASSAQLDRFRHWHQQGYIDIAGMQYNLTPLLDIEQMHRSLYPVRRLGDQYGLTVKTAMQCDVNGVSWLFANLLPAIGIEFLTLAINTFRGGAPRPLLVGRAGGWPRAGLERLSLPLRAEPGRAWRLALRGTLPRPACPTVGSRRYLSLRLH